MSSRAHALDTRVPGIRGCRKLTHEQALHTCVSLALIYQVSCERYCISRDMVIFVLTTRPITLPLAHAHGINTLVYLTRLNQYPRSTRKINCFGGLSLCSIVYIKYERKERGVG